MIYEPGILVTKRPKSCPFEAGDIVDLECDRNGVGDWWRNDTLVIGKQMIDLRLLIPHGRDPKRYRVTLRARG